MAVHSDHLRTQCHLRTNLSDTLSPCQCSCCLHHAPVPGYALWGYSCSAFCACRFDRPSTAAEGPACPCADAGCSHGSSHTNTTATDQLTYAVMYVRFQSWTWPASCDVCMQSNRHSAQNMPPGRVQQISCLLALLGQGTGTSRHAKSTCPDRSVLVCTNRAQASIASWHPGSTRCLDQSCCASPTQPGLCHVQPHACFALQSVDVDLGNGNSRVQQDQDNSMPQQVQWPHGDAVMYAPMKSLCLSMAFGC